MRLLHRNAHDEYVLTKFDNESALPQYAVLSHTWGSDADEVTLQDLVAGSGRAKAGYEKVRFCGEQAQNDGIEYFWIDTCCIYKDDKAELAYAISSMYHWYEKSARCYVYLADVSDSSDTGVLADVPDTSNSAVSEENSDATSDTSNTASLQWESEFRNSRWFTRGWTLQELLAPSSVEFFSKEGRLLGNKSSLIDILCEITAIPHAALRGKPLDQFSFEDRLSWKGKRETKLSEDGAYSMSGICFVRLPPVYGEGAELAFQRLYGEIRKTENCIRDLRLTDPRDDQDRIEATKGGLLEESYRWVLDESNFQRWRNDSRSSFLWIKGDPGKGKTMLMCGIIKELRKSVRDAIISSFFCQATDSRINSATTVLRGLLYLIVSQSSRVASHVRKRYDAVGSRTLFEDANAWTVLKETFKDVLRDPHLQKTYLVIDGLDECTIDLSELLGFIAEQSSRFPQVKWLISSRNWPELEYHLVRADHKVRLSLELNATSVAAAVNDFIQEKVSGLASSKVYDEQTRNDVLDYLVSNSDSTFLWVSLVCQVLQNSSRRHVQKKLQSLPPGLTSLYERMMHQIRGSDDAEVCTQILAICMLVHRPLTTRELGALVEELDEENPDMTLEIVGLCGSLLTMRDDTVYFVHQSAKDFLLEHAAKDLFPDGKHDLHHSIAVRSLHLMSRDLHRDMYHLEDPSFCFIAGDDSPPDPDPLGSSCYSCIHWVDHLCECDFPRSHSEVGSIIQNFLADEYLYWLEALSLCGYLPHGIDSLEKLGSLIEVSLDYASISFACS